MFTRKLKHSAYWLTGCYVLFGASTLVLQQHSAPLPPKPEFSFKSPAILAGAALNSAPLPLWEVVSVPVMLTAPTDKSVTVAVAATEKLPPFVQFVDESPLRFKAYADEALLRFKVDWRQVKKRTEVLLELPTTEAKGEQRCLVTFCPMPIVRCNWSAAVFQEGRDEKIVVNATLESASTEPVRLALELHCDEELTTSLPVRRLELVFAPGQTAAQAEFPAPDNSLATGDRKVSLTVKPAARRVDVASSPSLLDYDDDEQVYSASLSAIGAGAIPEAAKANDSVRKLTATISEAASTAGLVIPITYGGTAKRGSDFEGPDEFRFAENETEAHVEIRVQDDQLHEGHESLSVALPEREDLRLEGVSHQDFMIGDDDPLQIAVDLTTDPRRIVEGDSTSGLVLVLAPVAGQAMPNPWPAQNRRIRLSVKPSREGRPLPKLEIADPAEGVSTESELELDGRGCASVRMRAVDDADFQGMQTALVQLEAPQGMALVGADKLLVLIEDNEPVPASLSISGEGSAVAADNLVTVSEQDSSAGAVITVTLDDVAVDETVIGLKIDGFADAGDIRLRPSSQLLNDEFDGLGVKRIVIPKGGRTATVHVSAVNDDEFEGTQEVLFGIASSASVKAVKFLIKDDDPVRVVFEENPLIMREGETAKLRVLLKDAGDGLETPVGVALTLPTNGERDVKLSASEGTIPANKAFCEFSITAIEDSEVEGRERLRIALSLPNHKSSIYQADPYLDLQIDDEEFQPPLIAIMYTPEVADVWDELRVSLATLVADYKVHLAGGGILIVGDNGEAQTWGGDTARPSINPLKTLDAESILEQATAAILKAQGEGSKSSQAALIWNRPQTPTDLGAMVRAMPTPRHPQLFLLLFADGEPSKESDLFSIAANQKGGGAHSHRIKWTDRSFTQYLRWYLEDFLKKRTTK